MTEQTHITQCDDPKYLPFARSRIKAMRATGLRNLSQKFEVDGVLVSVSIDGEHSFVQIQARSGGYLFDITTDASLTLAAAFLSDIRQHPGPPARAPYTAKKSKIRMTNPWSWVGGHKKNPKAACVEGILTAPQKYILDGGHEKEWEHGRLLKAFYHLSSHKWVYATLSTESAGVTLWAVNSLTHELQDIGSFARSGVTGLLPVEDLEYFDASPDGSRLCFVWYVDSAHKRVSEGVISKWVFEDTKLPVVGAVTDVITYWVETLLNTVPHGGSAGTVITQSVLGCGYDWDGEFGQVALRSTITYGVPGTEVLDVMFGGTVKYSATSTRSASQLLVLEMVFYEPPSGPNPGYAIYGIHRANQIIEDSGSNIRLLNYHPRSGAVLVVRAEVQATYTLTTVSEEPDYDRALFSESVTSRTTLDLHLGGETQSWELSSATSSTSEPVTTQANYWQQTFPLNLPQPPSTITNGLVAGIATIAIGSTLTRDDCSFDSRAPGEGVLLVRVPYEDYNIFAVVGAKEQNTIFSSKDTSGIPGHDLPAFELWGPVAAI